MPRVPPNLRAASSLTRRDILVAIIDGPVQAISLADLSLCQPPLEVIGQGVLQALGLLMDLYHSIADTSISIRSIR